MTAAAKTLFGPKDGGTYAARALARWKSPPDWVSILADDADSAASLTDLAHRLGIASSSISAVIGNTYPGKLDAIEAKVRGVLMSARVTCPVLGEIARNACADHQAKPFSGASPSRAQLWKACRSKCPNAIVANLKKGAMK